MPHRGHPREGVGGEDKCSLSAGFSRIRASGCHSALPNRGGGRQTRGPSWLAMSAVASDYGCHRHSESRAEQTVSLVSHRECSCADESAVYLIDSFVIVRDMQAVCMKIAGHVGTAQKVKKASEQRSIGEIAFLPSSLFSRSQRGVTAITFCLLSWNPGSRRRLVSFRISSLALQL